MAARWWADQDEPVHALDHATPSRDRALLIELLHRFAIPLILTGDHGPLRRALARVGAYATASDPWLALTSALAHLEAGELPAAQADLRHARQPGPTTTPRISPCCGRSPSSSAPTSAVTGPLTRPRS